MIARFMFFYKPGVTVVPCNPALRGIRPGSQAVGPEVQIDVWTHKRDPICFMRDQIYGVFMGLWAKTKGFWIGRMRQEDV